MSTIKHEKLVKLHTYTHNCYKQIAEKFYAIFVKNINRIKKENLVKGSKFL